MNASYSTKNNFISQYKSFIDNSINKKDRENFNNDNINNSLPSCIYKEKCDLNHNNQNYILNTSYIKDRSRNNSPCLCLCHLNQRSLFLPKYDYNQDHCATGFTKAFLTKSHDVNNLKNDLLTKVNKLKINLKNFENELNKTKNEKKTLDLYRKKIEKDFSLPYTNKSFNTAYKQNQNENYSNNNNDKYTQMIYKNLEALDTSFDKANGQRRGMKGKLTYNINNNRKDYNSIIECQKKWLDTLYQNQEKRKNHLNDKIFVTQNKDNNYNKNNNYYFDYNDNNINTINNPEIYPNLNDKSNINKNVSSDEYEPFMNKLNSKVNYEIINNYSIHINNKKNINDNNNDDYSMIYPGNSIHQSKIMEQTKQILDKLNFKNDIDNTNNNTNSNNILNKPTLNNQNNNEYNNNNIDYDNNYKVNFDNNRSNNYNSNIICSNKYKFNHDINNNSNNLTYQYHNTSPNFNEKSIDKNLSEIKDNEIKNKNIKNEKYVILDNQGNPIYMKGHRLLGMKITKFIENKTNSLDKSSNIIYIDQNGNPIKTEDLKPIILDNQKPLVNEENKPFLGLNGLFMIDEDNNPICGPNELHNEQNKVIQGELGILPRDKKGNLITTTIPDKNGRANNDNNKQKRYTLNLIDILNKNKNINNTIKNIIKFQNQIKTKNNNSKYYPNLIKTNKSLDKMLFKSKYKFGNTKNKNKYKTTPNKRHNRNRHFKL